MLKKTITYEDFDGNQRTEDFYFNLTKAEIIEMEVSVDGGLSEALKKIVEDGDKKRIIEVLKDVIIKAYGVKSQDGTKFIKNDKLREEFVNSAAYSEIFTELATNESAAVAFVNGIIPKQAGTFEFVAWIYGVDGDGNYIRKWSNVVRLCVLDGNFSACQHLESLASHLLHHKRKFKKAAHPRQVLKLIRSGCFSLTSRQRGKGCEELGRGKFRTAGSYNLA